MAEISGFFNSAVDDEGNYDREYLAETFASYFASFIGNGVFPNPSNGLQVIASFGMNVILQAGQGWINGYWYQNTENLMLTLAPASGTTVRIDAVVFGWNASARRIYAYIKEGVPSLSPQKPLPQRNADAHERIVAYIRVERNIINITQSNIEDTRMDSYLCGIVHGVVEQIDTSTLGLQLQAFINESIEKYNNDYQEFTDFVAELKSGCNKMYSDFSNDINNLIQTATADYEQFADETKVLLQDVESKHSQFVTNLDTLFSQLQQNATNSYSGFIAFLQAYKNDSSDAYNALMLWFDNFKTMSKENFDAWFSAFKNANSSIFNTWYIDFISSNESIFYTWLSELKNTLDSNQASGLFNKIDKHEHSRIGDSDEEIHGLRFKNGKLQVLTEEGWATLASVPRGFNGTFFNAQGFIGQSFDMKQFTGNSFNSIIRAEVD